MSSADMEWPSLDDGIRRSRDDEYSLLFPDRPIRPLPRRLRVSEPTLRQDDLTPSPPPLHHAGSAKSVSSVATPVFFSPSTPSLFSVPKTQNGGTGPGEHRIGSRTRPGQRRTGGNIRNRAGRPVQIKSISSPLAFRPLGKLDALLGKVGAAAGSGLFAADLHDLVDNPSIKKRKVPIFGLGPVPRVVDTVPAGETDVSEPSEGSDADVVPDLEELRLRLRAQYGLFLAGTTQSPFPDIGAIGQSLATSPSSASMSSSHSGGDPNPSFSFNRSAFTFSCPNRAGAVSWPGPGLTNAAPARDLVSKPLTCADQQFTPTMPDLPTKPKRTVTQQYLLAESRRRRQQAKQNADKPPTKEELWICEFCEYESIFGFRPEALIRHFEAKDRSRRSRAARAQRTVEKPKPKPKRKKNRRKTAAAAPVAGSSSAPVPAVDGDEDGEEEEEEEDNDENGNEEAKMERNSDNGGEKAPPVDPAGSDSDSRPISSGRSRLIRMVSRLKDPPPADEEFTMSGAVRRGD